MLSLGGSSISNNNNNSISNISKFPFTATQWQELEHQALIYKYMISGLPIPPHLLFSVKRSLESTQHGWNCFPMGYGRKIDPEPGRCKRTDGKKWRCSKEAYTDSKYCERHMHRGRNRSRKPVEITSNPISSSSTTSVITQSPSSSLYSNNKSSSLSSMTFVDTLPSYDTQLSHPFLHPNSSSSRSLGFDFSSQDRDKDYRYVYGMKDAIDEHPFFSESSGAARDYSDSPSTLAHLKQNTADLSYPFLHLNDSSKQQKQDQYFNIMDSDFDKEMPMKLNRDDIKHHQVMHSFFEELPKNREPWKDKSSNYLSSSTTQLSMSPPNSSYNFFMSHNDK